MSVLGPYQVYDASPAANDAVASPKRFVRLMSNDCIKWLNTFAALHVDIRNKKRKIPIEDCR